MNKKNYIVLLFLVSIAISFVDAAPRSLTFFINRADRLVYSNREVLSVDLIDSTSPVYAATVFMTINVPFESAAKAIMDFDHWSSVFKNITKMKRVRDAANLRDSSIIYYAEAKYLMVRGWGLGVLDSMVYKQNRSLMVKVKPASSGLIQAYRVERKGKIGYAVNRLYVKGNLIKINDDQCRIGIFAWAGTNRYIPVWLLDAVVKFIMPNFVGDFETYVQKKTGSHSGNSGR